MEGSGGRSFPRQGAGGSRRLAWRCVTHRTGGEGRARLRSPPRARAGFGRESPCAAPGMPQRPTPPTCVCTSWSIGVRENKSSQLGHPGRSGKGSKSYRKA